MPYGAVDPLPQVLTAASTAANFYVKVAASTTSGGSWLVIPTGLVNGNSYSTPYAFPVSVNAAGLATGTYAGQIILKSTNLSTAQTVTIPVTLTVMPATATFFDNLPGQMTFSMLTSGNAPLSQGFQIRNAGAGTLAWTVTPSTFIGSGWLGVSSTNGTGSSTVNVTVTPSKMPGGGGTAGTYLGQLTVQTTGSTVTIPIRVTIGPNLYQQAGPLSFVMPYGAVNPLPQMMTIASNGVSFYTLASAYNSAGVG